MKHSLQKAWRIPKLSGRRFASGKWVERNRRRIVYRVSLTVTLPRRRGSVVASLTELVASTVIVSVEQGLFRSHDGCCLCILTRRFCHAGKRQGLVSEPSANEIPRPERGALNLSL
jgi:hypothetical protein